jgi:hypothetical protein
MVRLRVARRLSSISQTAMRETGSRPVVGSSRKKMLRIVDQAAGDFNAAAHSAGERLDLRAAPLDRSTASRTASMFFRRSALGTL